MRYIHLKLVKTDQDKKRVKGHPKMTSNELNSLVRDKIETKIITDATRKASEKRHAARQEKIFEEVSKTLSGKRHPLSKIIRDNYKSKKPPECSDGGETFLLNTMASVTTDLFFVQKIRENKVNDIRLYDELYTWVTTVIDKAPAKVKTRFSRLPVTHPLSSKNLAADLRALAALGLELFKPGRIKKYDPTNPGPEKGEGNKTDQYQSKGCGDLKPKPNPKGFLARATWPLKPHLTSTKNQGNRGTCTAFGTVGAIESKISVRYGEKVNLSEQDLYKKQKLDWNPNIFDDYYEDGYFPVMSMLFQMSTGYTFPLESAWEYNPSLSRKKNDSLRKYTHSCNDYSSTCSDTNHQASKSCHIMDITETTKVVTEVCEFIDGVPLVGGFLGWVCHSVTDWVEEVVGQVEVCVYDTNITGNSRYKLVDFGLIWDPVWDNDITLVKLALNQCKPVIFCFTVPKSFKTSEHSDTDGKGFVVYSASEKTPENAGGHCVELVGFVDNDEIPVSMDIDQGAGGGYFIIKNSWGRCFGDMGYAYLPYHWVNKWGTSMVVVNNVQQV